MAEKRYTDEQKGEFFRILDRGGTVRAAARAAGVHENAVAMRGDVAGCIVHSDRGSQFRSRKFRRALARHRMVGSMGRVGSSGDNAAMEASSLCCRRTS